MAEVDWNDECHGFFTCLTGGTSSMVLIEAVCCFSCFLCMALHYTTTR